MEVFVRSGPEVRPEAARLQAPILEAEAVVAVEAAAVSVMRGEVETAVTTAVAVAAARVARCSIAVPMEPLVTTTTIPVKADRAVKDSTAETAAPPPEPPVAMEEATFSSDMEEAGAEAEQVVAI